MYPEADVPVVMVSIDVTKDAEYIYELGKKLAPLREEGVLIVASGNVVHNLRLVEWDNEGGAFWAEEFNEAICEAVENKDFDLPLHYEKNRWAGYAVPTAEHYMPLPFVLGAVNEEDRVTLFNDYCELGSMSMTSFLFE